MIDPKLLPPPPNTGGGGIREGHVPSTTPSAVTVGLGENEGACYFEHNHWIRLRYTWRRRGEKQKRKWIMKPRSMIGARSLSDYSYGVVDCGPWNSVGRNRHKMCPFKSKNKTSSRGEWRARKEGERMKNQASIDVRPTPSSSEHSGTRLPPTGTSKNVSLAAYRVRPLSVRVETDARDWGEARRMRIWCLERRLSGAPISLSCTSKRRTPSAIRVYGRERSDPRRPPVPPL
ncbi:hypothetical protein B0H16DRAFT_1485278 [Mycena metata]|uniref:Uncharacterized protein n=1 Tax=Mycena metata TaxID=1033252 RepID=A0AAD7DNQ3_9AGAR|nr:hypothetical protein B0H16DRAFT_1485278 [Mycena metata]